MKNFPYRNFLRFEKDFELKSRKIPGFENQSNLMKFLLEPQEFVKFEQKATDCT
jgi:hypothetical protein